MMTHVKLLLDLLANRNLAGIILGMGAMTLMCVSVRLVALRIGGSMHALLLQETYISSEEFSTCGPP